MMPGGVAAQSAGLAVPHTQGPSAGGLRLAEGVAEHVQKVVRVRQDKAAQELVAALGEQRVAAGRVFVERDLAEREGFELPRRAEVSGGERDGDNGLGRQRRAGYMAHHRVRADALHVVSRLGRRPDHPYGRAGNVVLVTTSFS